MNASEEGFFTKHYDEFRRYEEALSSYAAESEHEQKLVQLIKAATSAISFSRAEYDALTPHTRRRQGKTLLEAMRSPLSVEKLERASYFLGAFIREATLAKDSRMGSEQLVLDHFLGVPNSESSDEWAGYGVDYVRYALPAALIEEKLAQLRGVGEDVAKHRRDTEEYLGQVDDRIQGYRGELDKISSDYNFVGLSHAFKQLLGQKNSDKDAARNLAASLAVLAVGLPLILLTPLRDFLFAWTATDTWSPSAVSRLIGVVGVELILLYFFRVALKSYLVARNQVTNLQLRLALCTFIEGYLEFSVKAPSASQGRGMEGFENLIFSDLPTDGGHVPSTFEGAEQLIGALSLVKKPA